ncbi:MAG TPA: anaerobic ribonucleoside-triphosphate reductase [Candidatus Moranbacteria bacterium]|nr:anaerobic ribonucleoside-triphosphate reductase [Candidatus Moranbacteria bacterium]
MEKYICHDCGKTLQKNEEFMSYETASGLFIKCKSCHKIDPVLRNFQKTEVYSRIVGYIRPVAQWNAGKSEEFKDRKEYSLNKSYC